ncbi:MAG: hypothetical protein HY921_05625 [Elusimicrobia bacterium]|nr:hypothetical protein [Elusimicrobiota bacterium]
MKISLGLLSFLLAVAASQATVTVQLRNGEVRTIDVNKDDVVGISFADAGASARPDGPAAACRGRSLNTEVQAVTGSSDESNAGKLLDEHAPSGNYSFHTARERNPWWEVDLGAVYRLDRVKIFNRTQPYSCGEGTCRGRAKTLQVLVAKDKPENLNSWYQDGWTKTYDNVSDNGGREFGGMDSDGPLVVSLKCRPARWLRLQLGQTGYLHLDKVDIFGTPAAE